MLELLSQTLKSFFYLQVKIFPKIIKATSLFVLQFLGTS